MGTDFWADMAQGQLPKRGLKADPIHTLYILYFVAFSIIFHFFVFFKVAEKAKKHAGWPTAFPYQPITLFRPLGQHTLVGKPL
jgi:hypothetical protein